MKVIFWAEIVLLSLCLPSYAGVLHSFGSLPDTGLVPMIPPVDGGNGFLYGTTSSGDATDGVLYAIGDDGGGMHVLHAFGSNSQDGTFPSGRLIIQNGVVYGVTQLGGQYGNGTIYCMDVSTRVYRILHSFGGAGLGRAPLGGLLKIGSKLYGSTAEGGSSSRGVLFEIGTDGVGFEILHHFGATAGDGRHPAAELVDLNGVLFGTTQSGGSFNKGTVFRFALADGSYQVLSSLGATLSDAAFPSGGLVVAAGELWGVSRGGTFGTGTVYKVSPQGTAHVVVKNFNESGSAGYEPSGTLVLANGTELYGTTEYGGNYDSGVVYRITTAGVGPTVRQHFEGSFGETEFPDGENPVGGLTLIGSTLYGACMSGGLFLEGSLFRVNTNGSGYELIHPFSGERGDGDSPSGVLFHDGVIYGTTENGGIYGFGTVYRVDPNGGDYRVLHHFNGDEGDSPNGELLVLDGRLYGTTRFGGTQGTGTIFSMLTDGRSFSLMRNMVSGTGSVPLSGLTHQAGLLYGTTSQGGTNNLGVTYRLQVSGSSYTVLRHHTTSDGSRPSNRPALNSTDLFVSTALNGAHNKGTVFRRAISSASLSVLRNFGSSASDQSSPSTLFWADSQLWGVASSGGALGGGGIFAMDASGANYSETKSFSSLQPEDGLSPQALFIGSGMSLFGSTQGGGADGNGTIWTMQQSGAGYQVIHSFEGAPLDGSSPSGDIAIDGSVVFSATMFGGEKDAGTVSAVYIGPSPQIETLLPTHVTNRSARLHANVHPQIRHGMVHFEFGTSIAYGSITDALPTTVSGNNPLSVEADLSGLIPQTTYQYRAVVSGPGWRVDGDNQTFTTVNSPPVVQPDTISILPGTRVTIDVLANDADPDGDDLAILQITQPTSGGVVTIENDKVVFAASEQFVSANFTYTASDGFGGLAVGLVTVSPVSSYVHWDQALTLAGLSNLGGPLDDGDHDSLANLAEYALGLTPQAPNVGILHSTLDAGVLRLQFVRWKHAADVSIIPQISSDLIDWSSEGVVVQVLTDDGNRQTVLATFPARTGRVFGRLKFQTLQ